MVLLGLLLGAGTVFIIIFSAGIGLVPIIESKWPLPTIVLLVVVGSIIAKISNRKLSSGAGG